MRFGALPCGRGASSSRVSRVGGLSVEQGSTVDGRVICCGDNGLINFICAGFWFAMCVLVNSLLLAVALSFRHSLYSANCTPSLLYVCGLNGGYCCCEPFLL